MLAFIGGLVLGFLVGFTFGAFFSGSWPTSALCLIYNLWLMNIFLLSLYSFVFLKKFFPDFICRFFKLFFKLRNLFLLLCASFTKIRIRIRIIKDITFFLYFIAMKSFFLPTSVIGFLVFLFRFTSALRIFGKFSSFLMLFTKFYAAWSLCTG